METPYLLHVFSPTKYVSPFDINMAYEANYDAVIPYCNVELEEIHALTQDTIFSRRPEGVERTGIFIGGRDLDLAIDMMDEVRKAMVPPFVVSVMADPSGAITTAAAMVAAAEKSLADGFGESLEDKRVYVFGGTGPVGKCVALLAAMCNAKVSIVSHRGLAAAQSAADKCNLRYDINLQGADGSAREAVENIMGQAEVVFNTAQAGVRIVDSAMLGCAHHLRLAIDANAVPPSGIEGLGANDDREALATANGQTLGIGALAIGNIKYQVHTRLLTKMYQSSEPVYLAYLEAFELARSIVAAG